MTASVGRAAANSACSVLRPSGKRSRLQLNRPNKMIGVRVLIVITALLAFPVGCGPSLIHVAMECVSPDAKLNAVLWAESGGGAAGWVEAFLSVLPGPATLSNVGTRS